MNSNPNTLVAGLVERLRHMARNSSEAQRMIAEAKTARQTDRDDAWTDAGYGWPSPEETTEWQAASHIEQLEADKRALESRIAATIKVIEEGYPGTPKAEQCKHGHYGFEECIACYDEALLSAISNPSPVKGTE